MSGWNTAAIGTNKRKIARIFKEYYLDGVHAEDDVIDFVTEHWADYQKWRDHCYGPQHIMSGQELRDYIINNDMELQVINGEARKIWAALVDSGYDYHMAAVELAVKQCQRDPYIVKFKELREAKT